MWLKTKFFLDFKIGIVSANQFPDFFLHVPFFLFGIAFIPAFLFLHNFMFEEMDRKFNRFFKLDKRNLLFQGIAFTEEFFAASHELELEKSVI